MLFKVFIIDLESLFRWQKGFSDVKGSLNIILTLKHDASVANWKHFQTSLCDFCTFLKSNLFPCFSFLPPPHLLAFQLFLPLKNRFHLLYSLPPFSPMCSPYIARSFLFLSFALTFSHAFSPSHPLLGLHHFISFWFSPFTQNTCISMTYRAAHFQKTWTYVFVGGFTHSANICWVPPTRQPLDRVPRIETHTSNDQYLP